MYTKHKLADHIPSVYALSQDFLNAIDANDLNTVLAFQVHGKYWDIK